LQDILFSSASATALAMGEVKRKELAEGEA